MADTNVVVLGEANGAVPVFAVPEGIRLVGVAETGALVTGDSVDSLIANGLLIVSVPVSPVVQDESLPDSPGD